MLCTVLHRSYNYDNRISFHVTLFITIFIQIIFKSQFINICIGTYYFFSKVCVIWQSLAELLQLVICGHRIWKDVICVQLRSKACHQPSQEGLGFLYAFKHRVQFYHGTHLESCNEMNIIWYQTSGSGICMLIKHDSYGILILLRLLIQWPYQFVSFEIYSSLFLACLSSLIYLHHNAVCFVVWSLGWQLWAWSMMQ